MFERRLKIVLLVPIFYSLVLIARLYSIQIAQGDEFEQMADEALVAPRKFLPPLRGRILDRFGRPLVSDEPATDIAVHYGVLSMNESYIQRVAERLRRTESRWKKAPLADAEFEVRMRIARMWRTFSRLSGSPMERIRARRDSICKSVEALREHISKARRRLGIDEPIDKLRLQEEEQFHSILRDVSPEIRAQLEVDLTGLPFMRIEPSVRRVWSENAEPLCHALGTLGQVSPERLRNDPRADDRLGAYRPGDEAGVSGIERLCEERLRGKRGFEEKYLDGRVKSSLRPVDGADVQLTIDLMLQARIQRILAESIAADPSVTGASCVVIDIPTREILAMARPPTFSQERVRREYETLRDDARYRPLLFRAVSEEYQPGSILKPAALLAAFRYGVMDVRQTVHCDGSYVPGSNNWHCWTHWKNLPGHGDLTAVEAIKHSCNVFFYTLGDRLHAGRLTQFYREFVLGPEFNQPNRSVTGLIEERDGILPTRDYLQTQHRRDFRPADGRNYAIGQGEVQITPLQGANMYATLAAGQYRDPTLIAGSDVSRGRTEIEGISPVAWRTMRNGIYNCVNDPGGTAYKHARLEDLEICGKTGSAQCVARVIESRYTFDVDGEPLICAAPTLENAREQLGIDSKHPCVKREVLRRRPPNVEGKTEPPTHAWFAGFAPYERPHISLVVLLEHGGGGGQAAGPIGREVFRTLIELGYLKAKVDPIYSSNLP